MTHHKKHGSRKKKKTNRLAMVSKSRSRTTSKRQKSVKKVKGIKDVPLAKKLSQGTKASLGSIDYHYQKYYNTFAFLEELVKKNFFKNDNWKKCEFIKIIKRFKSCEGTFNSSYLQKNFNE